MFGRTKEVRIGKEFSSRHIIENGIPQCIVCGPLLFNIMINYIFEQIEHGIEKYLYADDGALWIWGINIEFMKMKKQIAIKKVE